MIVIMSECAGTGGELFADLAKYTSVVDYITDVIAEKDSFHPLFLTVKFDGIQYTICHMGAVALYAEQCLNELRQLPESRLQIPNENMNIVVDSNARDVRINLP